MKGNIFMKKIHIEKERLEKLIQSGKPKKQIYDELGYSPSAVRRCIKEYGLEFKTVQWNKGKESKYRNNSFINEQWLIDNWVNTDKSLKELAKEYDISDSVLEYRTNFYGLTKKYKHPLNREKLFDITSPRVWYLAGLVATDGYLPKGKNAIEISLCGDSEKRLLQDIVKYFELKYSIKKYGNANQIRMSCDGIDEFFLTNFGINDGAKTFTVGFPSTFYNENCAKAFILGCIDGDGYVSKSINRLSILTASHTFISGIAETLQKYTGVKTKVQFEHKRSTEYPCIRVQGNRAKKILDWVYSLEDCFRLDRKYQNYKKVNDIV